MGARYTGKRAITPLSSKRWHCLQYLVDNECPGWEEYAEKYADHLR